MLTQRERQRYFKQKRHGGKTTFARALDYIALRVILFLAAFLFFRIRLDTLRASILAAILLLSTALLLHAIETVRLERFIRRETVRIRRLLMQQSLALLDEDAFLQLCKRTGGEQAIPLQVAEAVSADMLLPLLRKHRRGCTVCSSAGFTQAAEELATRSTYPIRLLGTDALLSVVHEGDALWADDAAICAYIEAERRRGKRMRSQLKKRFAEHSSLYGRKYLLTAGLLFLLSFFTRYTLYYRLLATVSMTVAGTVFLLSVRTHAHQGGDS